MTDHDIRRFTAYRPRVAEFGKHSEDQMNAPDEVQYEGVVFSDGSCALRWRTAVNSTSLWDSFEDAMRIHGHPEYGTRIVFHDEPLPLPWEEEQDEDLPPEFELLLEVLAGILGGDVKVKRVSLEDFRKDLSSSE
jgi:hypothetical protein